MKEITWIRKKNNSMNGSKTKQTANNWAELKCILIRVFSMFRARIVCDCVCPCACWMCAHCISAYVEHRIQKNKYKDILIDWKSGMYGHSCACLCLCLYTYLFCLIIMLLLLLFFRWLLSFTYVRIAHKVLKLNWKLNQWHSIYEKKERILNFIG